jgi:uncharacterized protein
MPRLLELELKVLLPLIFLHLTSLWLQFCSQQVSHGQRFLLPIGASNKNDMFQPLLVMICNGLGALLLAVLLTPWILASMALLLHWNDYVGSQATTTTTRSALYAGRVWHTRFHPVRHAFSYPLFIFCIDLQEVEGDNSEPPLAQSKPSTVSTSPRCYSNRTMDRLWPLTLIASFRPADHLKNGEGQHQDKSSSSTLLLSERVCRLVAERTRGSFCPSPTTHRIMLVTHWTYFGYCFNPVSFYYVKERLRPDSNLSTNADKEPIRAVVGEVSNTPWNEMYCYVLHPDSMDKVCTAVTMEQTHPSEPLVQKLRYVFPKKFHVSPFMEMDYDYDWTFRNFSTTARRSQGESSWIQVTNSLRIPHAPRQDPSMSGATGSNGTTTVAVPADAIAPPRASPSPGTLQFHASMKVERFSMHPYRIAWQMSILPLHCAVIQLWIHYEAACLFLKGVIYQPHPTGAETQASRWIGNVMVPFFALRDWWKASHCQLSSTRDSSSKQKTS